ncbi:putative Zinc finger protein ZPR1 [Sclerotinia borealis F-4128]|uniref:Putative Zinc finger protein ZPR1 n=1 Tax=Sclerotinia borealis (strain F-4128) TaxID=1432307 RepID=W9CL35_SCLBF|nr:putative Zinc finger protein ZPR1 [Sclerotinia borealis F-4128]
MLPTTALEVAMSDIEFFGLVALVLDSKETTIQIPPDGAVFDDYFESLGKKAQNLSTNDQKNDVATDGTLESDEDQRVVDEIESLCMNCHENGITRLLLTRIPYFREIILMSFYCPHCNFKNAEIQSAGEIQQKGSRFELRLTTPEDFARQVVKSDTCIVKFIELDLEVPQGRGQLTNVEGLLSMILDDLALKQPERKEQIPEVYVKVEEVITKGRKMLAGEAFPFRLSIDDPAGNSWIEPDQKDGVGKLAKIQYPRTPEQNEVLGLGGDEEATETQAATGGQPTAATFEDDDIIPNEVYSFPATCPGCTKHCVTHMKMVDIPHFKQVVLMSTVCEHCGYRSNEVKTGGEVPEKGKCITLKVESAVDLARDILKSESCALECPELKLSVNPGTLGGRFTTVEGLLVQVRDDLHQQIFDVGDDAGEGGDGMISESKKNWKAFFDGIDEAIKGERKFTIILRDPLASSYVQNLCSPDADPLIETEEYERTADEEEDLGLSDMKTEDYVDEVGNEKKRVEAEKAEAEEKKE